MPISITSSAAGLSDINLSIGNRAPHPASASLPVMLLIRSKSLASRGFIESPPAVMWSAEELVRGSNTEV